MSAAAGIDPKRPKLYNKKKLSIKTSKEEKMVTHLEIDFISRSKSITRTMKTYVEMRETM